MDRIQILIKGLLMGACDIIPGVSGGTMAFITGIYNTLIDSLNALNRENLKLLLKGKFKIARKNINGNFLLILFIGILISVFTLSRLIDYLLTNYEIFVWAFFFGLILASAIIMIKGIKKKDTPLWLLFMVGCLLGLLIAKLNPIELGNGLLTMLGSGAIAIIAMILPGISGAYILLMLGQYQEVLSHVVNISSGNFSSIIYLLAFIVGAFVGLLLFSKLLFYIKSKRYKQMVMILTGIMIGSLYKLWPWKQVVETYIDRHGETQTLVEKSILPTNIAPLINGEGLISEFRIIALLCLSGILVVFGFYAIGRKK